MVVLVGTNPLGDSFIVVGTTGSVSGGPAISPVSGIQALGGPDFVNILGNTNLFDGIATEGGNDTVVISSSGGAAVDLGEGDNSADITDSNFFGALTGGSGNDIITLLRTILTGGLDAGGGNNEITATGTGSEQIGGLTTGNGDDRITIDSMVVNTTFNTGNGADVVNLINSTINSALDLGQGANTLLATGTTFNQSISASGNFSDNVTLTDVTIFGTLRTRGGADSVTVDGSTNVTGNINTGGQADIVSVGGSASVQNVNLGGGQDQFTLQDGASVNNLSGANGSDIVKLRGGSINSVSLGNNNDEITVGDSVTVSSGISGNGGFDLIYLPEGTQVNDSSFGSFTIVNGQVYQASSGSFTLPGGNVVTYQQFEEIEGVPCFTAGTEIDTERGAVPVQELQIGDLVRTLDHGLVPVRWIGMRRLSASDLRSSPKLCPICIPAGALGPNCPETDLIVSPQHRIFIHSKIAERMFGNAEILVPAIKLIGFGGTYQMTPDCSVTYVHMLFDRHEIITSNGAWSESLFLGSQAFKSLGRDAREEILALFPSLAAKSLPAARPVIQRNKLTRSLVRRHNKNAKPLCNRRRA